MSYQDLTGMTFGRWKVLRQSPIRRNQKIYWICECQCENKTIKEVQGQHLKSGASQSCGCLRKEITSQRTKKDMMNQRFGHLVVIGASQSAKDRHATWMCQCDCGNIIEVTGYSLRSGATKSCGCIKSFGQDKIIQIFKTNDIIFQTEKDFDNCRYPDTNFKAKFDFWVDNSYLIEFDGKQHFGIGGWNNQKAFEKTQQHDNFKNQWCEQNNIPLIRIPYTQYDKLTVEDLKLETSKFRVV